MQNSYTTNEKYTFPHLACLFPSVIERIINKQLKICKSKILTFKNKKEKKALFLFNNSHEPSNHVVFLIC